MLFLQKFVKIDDLINIDEIGCPSLKVIDGNQYMLGMVSALSTMLI